MDEYLESEDFKLKFENMCFTKHMDYFNTIFESYEREQSNTQLQRMQQRINMYIEFKQTDTAKADRYFRVICEELLNLIPAPIGNKHTNVLDGTREYGQPIDYEFLVLKAKSVLRYGFGSTTQFDRHKPCKDTCLQAYRLYIFILVEHGEFSRALQVINDVIEHRDHIFLYGRFERIEIYKRITSMLKQALVTTERDSPEYTKLVTLKKDYLSELRKEALVTFEFAKNRQQYARCLRYLSYYYVESDEFVNSFACLLYSANFDFTAHRIIVLEFLHTRRQMKMLEDETINQANAKAQANNTNTNTITDINGDTVPIVASLPIVHDAPQPTIVANSPVDSELPSHRSFAQSPDAAMTAAAQGLFGDALEQQEHQQLSSIVTNNKTSNQNSSSTGGGITKSALDQAYNRQGTRNTHHQHHMSQEKNARNSIIDK